MQNTFYLSLGQAAKETGRSKSVIFKALESGKLSYVEKTTSGYKIDPAELFRVFPRTVETEQKERLETTRTDAENEFLKRENELLRQQLERERSQIDDLRTDRDHWRQQATNLLTHQPEPAAAPETEPRRLSSFMSWALGKKS